MTTLGLRDLGFLASLRGDPDPNFSSVSLLLHGDGANGSTTITDSSSSPKTVTAFGDAKISTAQSKFGGASLLFDGVGDYLTAPSNAALAFGSSDFTIEAWVYLTSSKRHTLLAVGTQVGGIAININQPGLLTGTAGIEVCRSGTAIDHTFPATVPSNQWVFLGIRRSGTNLSCTMNGASLGTQTNNRIYAQSEFVIGYDGDKVSYPFFGHIDDLRITKSVARDISTVPTAPFPDF